MPILIDTPVGPPPNGGGVLVPRSISAGTIGRPVVTTAPIQVCGLVPLTVCTLVECRQAIMDCCYVNRVFGELLTRAGGPSYGNPISSYKNDMSTFLVDYQLSSTNPNATISFIIQKCTGTTWSDLVTISNNSYGTFYPLKTFTEHLTYAGVTLNWGLILKSKGAGCYRLKVTTTLGAGGSSPLDSCLISEPFELFEFNCDRAHNTVKFEITRTGKIGDVVTDGRVIDICGINLYDSIRFHGFFGSRKIAESLEIVHEYQNTYTTTIRDEAVPRYWFRSEMVPAWLSDRFQIYALTGGSTLLVSDYNINNSRYDIKQRLVTKAGVLKPEDHSKDWNRTENIEGEFFLGYRGLIYSSCCTPVKII